MAGGDLSLDEARGCSVNPAASMEADCTCADSKVDVNVQASNIEQGQNVTKQHYVKLSMRVECTN
jgi:hypothetical protein